MSESYELRVSNYFQLSVKEPARHVIPGLGEWLAYWCETDCDDMDWEDRANSEYQWGNL